MTIRTKLVAYRENLFNIKTPVITAQMRHGGLKTRPQRQAIRKYKQDIKKEIERVDKELVKKDIVQFDLKTPKLKKTRIKKRKFEKLRRMRWVL